MRFAFCLLPAEFLNFNERASIFHGSLVNWNVELEKLIKIEKDVLICVWFMT